MTQPGEARSDTSAWRVEVVDGSLTRELRRSVLRPNVPPQGRIPGDDLPDATHIAALTPAGLPASACFIYPDPCPFHQCGPDEATWHLRQMATDPDWRGHGAGAAVIHGVLRVLRTSPPPTAPVTTPAGQLWCYARESAGGFYQRLGFQIVGDVFTDDQHPIPHLRMWRGF